MPGLDAGLDGGARLIHDYRGSFNDFWDALQYGPLDAGQCP